MKKTIKKAVVSINNDHYKLTLGRCDKTNSCYSHIGQHSACHPNYAKECREATMLEYLDLFNELQSIGYRLELI